MAKKDTLIIAFYWGVGSQEQGFHGSFLCRNYACQAGAASIAPVLTKLPVVPPVLGTDPTASPMGSPCAHRPRARGRPQPSGLCHPRGHGGRAARCETTASGGGGRGSLRIRKVSLTFELSSFWKTSPFKPTFLHQSFPV